MEAALLENLVLIVAKGRESQLLLGYVKNSINLFRNKLCLTLWLEVGILILNAYAQPTLVKQLISPLICKVNEVSFFSTLEDLSVESLQLQLALFDEVVLLMSKRD